MSAFRNFLSNTNTLSTPSIDTKQLIIDQGSFSTRNDYYWFGGQFSPKSNITITALQRLVLSGNTLSHNIIICNDTEIICFDNINTAGISANTYATTFITPVMLIANSIYTIAIQEGGDNAANYHGVTPSSDILWLGNVYSVSAPQKNSDFQLGGGDVVYSTPNALYH